MRRFVDEAVNVRGSSMSCSTSDVAAWVRDWFGALVVEADYCLDRTQALEAVGLK